MNGCKLLRITACGLALAATMATSPVTAQHSQRPKVKFSAVQAQGAALMKYPGGKVQGKPELENEEGKWQYAVMVKAAGRLHEVMVGANSGKIESEETVTPKEEAAEKRAEANAGKHPKAVKSAKSGKATRSAVVKPQDSAEKPKK